MLSIKSSPIHDGSMTEQSPRCPAFSSPAQLLEIQIWACDSFGESIALTVWSSSIPAASHLSQQHPCITNWKYKHVDDLGFGLQGHGF